MAQARLRVLVDLSMAARGYCGIAQDVRMLYKALAMRPELEVTALVYPRRLGQRKLAPASARRAERLTSQACFLCELNQERDFPPLASWQTISHLPRLVSTVLTERTRLERLEVDIFWEALWRLLFSPSLAPQDIPLVRNGRYLLANFAAATVRARTLLGRRPLKLDTRGYDFFIVQGERSFRVAPETRQVVRFHDLIPLRHPDSRPHALDVAWHDKAMQQRREQAHYVCNSEPTRDDLNDLYPELREASSTIPCILSDTYWPESAPEALRSIIELRRSSAAGATSPRRLKRKPRYILGVSTLEPRKNFLGLLSAFHSVRARSAEASDLKLVIVGSPGWKFEPILSALRPAIERGEVIHLEKVSTEELRVLYSHAEALVFPSYAEGFGIPPLEAMRCDTPVIASDVPAHRWALGDAALYCNPYDVGSIAAAIERLVAASDSQQLRGELVARGRQRAERYSLGACSEMWLDLLYRLHGRQPEAIEPQHPGGIQTRRVA